jgi:serine/threonine protein kinase
MLGRTISHYRITSQLGAGGMGVVYAGEDIRLGRPVALKFVPEELADPRAFERLRIEARAASALNHANICTIYDVGEYEGRPYLVMELLKGHTLRDSLAAGPLKVHQTVDIGIQVADALDAAHGRGILHRDIKPANLFLVERGVVKILDFGLAKHLPGEDSRAPSHTVVGTTTAPEPLTGEGVTVGTVSYMSPEQVTGEHLDGRTDLFSLGIVLYECATGHRPFTGKTSALILSAILNEAPVAPVVFNPQIPARLHDVINACLEKDRELRYQDAAGLRADLKRVRRDLESGHSNAMRAISASQASGPGSRRGSASNQTAQGPSSGQRSKPKAWGAALAASAIAAGTSYWFWFRTPAPPPPAPADREVSSSDTGERNRIGLATSSLEAGRYREALTYAQEVLRLFPDHAEARRVRDEASGALARFDEAIARGRRLIASGDPEGASEALRAARGIDASSPAVAALSEEIVAQYKTQAATRQRADASAARTVPAPSRPTSSEPRSTKKDTQTPATSEPATTPSSVTPPASAAPPPPEPPRPEPAKPEQGRPEPPKATPPPPERAPVAPATPAPSNPVDAAATPPKPVEPAPSRPAAPPPANPPDAAGAPAENDDALITRVVEGWAHAIENKDLAAYRALKPNMTATEQRRIEDGFRAVASQRVAVTILGIEKRGAQALVRLRRRDTIMVDGRQQVQDSQQTLTVVRAGSGWVIRDIGR